MRWNPLRLFQVSKRPPSRPVRRLRVEPIEDRLMLAALPSGFSESLVAGGLNSPTAMEFAPDGRLFVAEQTGALRVIQNGALLPTPFVNLPVNSAGERGLLGVAFDPNFATNQFVYVYYTATSPTVHNRISRFTANGNVAVAGSEVVIMDLENLSATNHNGGAIHFGPDGKLYVAVGENAVASNSQTLANRLGKMLRINPDGSIPTDNPFFNQATGLNRSIWAIGLRNPFTFTFQPGTGRMFINDVGATTWEEINDGLAGANYGWPNAEGPSSNPSFTNPLFHYGHGNSSTTGCAITGGAFYNPSIATFPADYLGDYFFADFCSGWIRRFDPVTSVTTSFATNISLPVDLKVTPDGSLYYLARGSGQVWRVAPTQSTVVVDNGQTGFSTLGAWFPSVGEGFQGDIHFSPTGAGDDVATWTIPVSPGRYRVATTWSPHPNRATNAPFRVFDGSRMLADVSLNQELAPDDFSDAGTTWENLGGIVTVLDGMLTVRLNNLANEYVIADAVRVERVGNLPGGPEITVLDGNTEIVDGSGVVDFGSVFAGALVDKTFRVRNDGIANLSVNPIGSGVPAGFSVVADIPGGTMLEPGTATTFTLRFHGTASPPGMVSFTTGDADENPYNFTVSGAVIGTRIVDDGQADFSTAGAWFPSAGEGFQADIHFSPAGTGSNLATWTIPVSPGLYRVAVTWSPHPNRATNAPFSIFDGPAVRATANLNQELFPNDLTDAGTTWEFVGGIVNIAGNMLTVRLTNQANEYVIADAVRVERLGDLPSGPEIVVLEGDSDIADGTGMIDFGSTFVGLPLEKTFRVRNIGSSILSVSQIGAGVPAGFSVVTDIPPNTMLNPGDETSFTLRFDATASAGGMVSFGNSDSDESPFNFDISGSVVATRILDNGETGFSTLGIWYLSAGEGFQSGIHFSPAGSGGDVATWTIAVSPGQYRVAATWSPHPNRATNAPFSVFDGPTQLAAVLLNQEQAPDDFADAVAMWEQIGGVLNVTGNTLVVRLTNLADEYVIADALRIERIG